jgi:hypothetical protein
MPLRLNWRPSCSGVIDFESNLRAAESGTAECDRLGVFNGSASTKVCGNAS